MDIEMYCSKCHCRFPAVPETLSQDLLDRLTAEGPWEVLGDGETFEDTIDARPRDQSDPFCPQCGQGVAVTEDSLGRLAMQVLAGW